MAEAAGFPWTVHTRPSLTCKLLLLILDLPTVRLLPTFCPDFVRVTLNRFLFFLYFTS